MILGSNVVILRSKMVILRVSCGDIDYHYHVYWSPCILMYLEKEVSDQRKSDCLTVTPWLCACKSLTVWLPLPDCLTVTWCLNHSLTVWITLWLSDCLTIATWLSESLPNFLNHSLTVRLSLSDCQLNSLTVSQTVILLPLDLHFKKRFGVQREPRALFWLSDSKI